VKRVNVNLPKEAYKGIKPDHNGKHHLYLFEIFTKSSPSSAAPSPPLTPSKGRGSTKKKRLNAKVINDSVTHTSHLQELSLKDIDDADVSRNKKGGKNLQLISEKDLGNSHLVEQIEESLLTPAVQQDITVKSNAKNKSIKTKVSLSHRQNEKQAADLRLLFVSHDEELCDTWVCILNYLRLSLEQQ
jgi:hypothetical protein